MSENTYVAVLGFIFFCGLTVLIVVTGHVVLNAIAAGCPS